MVSFPSVPMVQTLKNVANLVTVTGDYYIFGEVVTPLSLTAILVMVIGKCLQSPRIVVVCRQTQHLYSTWNKHVAFGYIGAIFASANDLEFNFLGYFWMTVNCIRTACELIDVLTHEHLQYCSCPSTDGFKFSYLFNSVFLVYALCHKKY